MAGHCLQIWKALMLENKGKLSKPSVILHIVSRCKSWASFYKYVMHILFVLPMYSLYSRDFVAVILPDVSLDSCQVINHTGIEE